MQLLHSITAEAITKLQRIDVFLSSKLRKFSRNKIQNLIHKKAILVNGIAVEADYIVKSADKIEVFALYTEFNENVTPENIPIDIIYEDEYLIVVNKPAGMPVHKGLGNFKGTLLNALAYYFSVTNKTIAVAEGAVHRLDRGTSGLLVFAKNKAVKKNLELQIKNNLMHRTYNALVWGMVKQEEGTIDIPIGRNKTNPMIIQTFPTRDEGKEAVTHYKILRRFRYVTLVACSLQTGRTHQIRLHLQYLGHALLGDSRYGCNFTFKEVRNILEEEKLTHQLLHARQLDFQHPVTNIKCSFEAPLNRAFEIVLGKIQQQNL